MPQSVRGARESCNERTCDSLAVDVSERYRKRFVTEQANLQIGGPELRWETLKEMRLGVRVVWHMRLERYSTAPAHLRHVLRSPKKPKLLSNVVYLESLT
jgi:hypothetical protein